MCGISGFVDDKSSCEKSLESLSQMLRTIDHRGPDSSDIFSEGPIYLGHNRLAIIDLSSQGHQPKESISSRYVCSFNGEIYNYKILRAELIKKGYKFFSTSDTEVLLALIDELGFEEAVKRCIGMFAISIWDRKEKKIKLARDRFGEKPLYFGWHKGSFIFGSELKALIKHHNFKKDICSEALNDYFHFNYIPAPKTIYENTYKLEPGKILTLDLSKGLIPGSEIIQEYWSLEEVTLQGLDNPYKEDFESASMELESILVDSIKLQMQSDVPLGALLSGGIDSSLIAALMQKESKSNINTFTIGFADTEFNEAKHAKFIADYLGTNHTELYLEDDHITKTALKMSSIFDEPFSDPSQIPTYLVSELAKEKVTVSLSGDGGDELFYGYSKYLKSHRISRLPFRRSIARLMRFLPIGSLNKLPSLIQKNSNLSPSSYNFLIELLNSRDYTELSKLLSIDRKANQYLLNMNTKDYYIDEVPSKISTSVFETAVFLDRKGYLPDDILTKVDRTSMKVSLENRVPLLDHRIIEFTSRLPSKFIFNSGVQKKILKNILFKQIPRNLLDRPKTGFSPPIANWLRFDLKDWALNLLEEGEMDSDFVDLHAIKILYDEHIANKKDNSIMIWKVLMYLDWKRTWM